MDFRKMKDLRKRQNLTQEKLAQMFQLSRSTITKWETGKTYPSIRYLDKLCTILKCTPKQLGFKSEE